MDLATYQREAARTLRTDEQRFYLGAVLGLGGEAGEVAEVVGASDRPDLEKLAKELGDCYWYAAAIATWRGLHLFQLMPSWGEPPRTRMEPRVWALMVTAARILDQVKKEATHDHPEDLGALVTLLATYIGNLDWIGRMAGLERGAILGINIDRLWLRYPQGFSPAASIVRVDIIKPRKLAELVYNGEGLA